VSNEDADDISQARRRLTARLTGIYALVEPERRAPVPFVEALLDAGVRIFQLRAKRGIERETLCAIVERVRAARGVALVNDDVDAAAEADGVHLGQEDAALHDLAALRLRLGGRIIGLSCGTPAEARAAQPALIDYLGIGPIFATTSKADAGPPIGVSGVRAVVAATRLPTAAIGGIDLARLQHVRESGVSMAAIAAALAEAHDVTANARAFVSAWTT
jgi:thiamine-phosphate diphosphorylase